MENQRPNQVRTFEAFPVPGYVAANHPQNNLRDIGQTSAVNKVKAGTLATTGNTLRLNSFM